MIEKDNIQELFSKAFENQTAPVRPDLWAGVQAKMAAAGVASTATVATKGLSALTKWLIGSAAVGTVGVVTAVIALNSGEETTDKKNEAPKEISQNVQTTGSEENKEEQAGTASHTIYTKPKVVPGESFETPKTEESHHDMKYQEEVPDVKENSAETPKVEKSKQYEEKPYIAENPKRETPEKKDLKDTKKAPPVTDSKGSEDNGIKEQTDSKDVKKSESVVKVTNFPNIFTPNGDHDNDVYQVQIENVSAFKMTIVDEKNRPLFQTNDPNEVWDGKSGGEDVKAGSYAVFIDGKDINGKEFHKAQIIQLIR